MLRAAVHLQRTTPEILAGSPRRCAGRPTQGCWLWNWPIEQNKWEEQNSVPLKGNRSTVGYPYNGIAPVNRDAFHKHSTE